MSFEILIKVWRLFAISAMFVKYAIFANFKRVRFPSYLTIRQLFANSAIFAKYAILTKFDAFKRDPLASYFIFCEQLGCCSPFLPFSSAVRAFIAYLLTLPELLICF